MVHQTYPPTPWWPILEVTLICVRMEYNIVLQCILMDKYQVVKKILQNTSTFVKQNNYALLIVSRTPKHIILSNMCLTLMSRCVSAWSCLLWVCVVLITLIVSTKQLPHFSLDEHTHSDLTCTSRPFSLLPLSVLFVCPIGFWVCPCMCVLDLLTFYWCPFDPPSVSGVFQCCSQHISHPKAALQPQNTHIPPTAKSHTQLHR